MKTSNYVMGTYLGCKYKSTSLYGNPSYYLWLVVDGQSVMAQTASNASCGYSVRNNREGDVVYLKYHVTKKGTMIIDYLLTYDEYKKFVVNKGKKNKKFLTVQNKARIYKALKNYLCETIQLEEHLNTFDKVLADVIRVKCYKTSPTLTIDKVDEYLRGLSLSVMFSTYNICKFCFTVLGLDYDKDSNNFIEEAYDIDCFYWHSLAKIIYAYYVRKGGM